MIVALLVLVCNVCASTMCDSIMSLNSQPRVAQPSMGLEHTSVCLGYMHVCLCMCLGYDVRARIHIIAPCELNFLSLPSLQINALCPLSVYYTNLSTLHIQKRRSHKRTP